MQSSCRYSNAHRRRNQPQLCNNTGETISASLINTNLMHPIGIFGGTFDPIHYGHLRTAFELIQALRLSEVRFMPAGDPPHRDATIASPELRLQMVKAAIGQQPGFNVDDREMRRAGPSYSVDTLAELRAELPDRSLCLIVGMDAFLGLPTWHQWQNILTFSHL